MIEPKILIGETVGKFNEDLDKSIKQIDKSMMYEDLSTIIITPTRGLIPARVVQSWMKLMRPVNQRTAGPIFAEAMKVDDAYNSLIRYILRHPYLSTFKYVLTIEEDNIPPSDGLIRLYEGMKDYDVIGGLYWGKAEETFPMIFGDPNKGILDSSAQIPKKGEIQHCNALGMGFTLFKLDMFRQIEEPWFKTIQEKDAIGGDQIFTQDFFFFRKAAEKGFKFAVDNRVLVGHYNQREDKVY